MSERKIIITYDPPPIPMRLADYSARREGCDEADPIGYGSTEAIAIADLLDLEACAQDEAEARAARKAVKL